MRRAKTVTLSQESIYQVDLLSRVEAVSFSNLVDRVLQEYLRQPEVQKRIARAEQAFGSSHESISEER